MAQLALRAGLDAAVKLPNSAIWIVGQNKLLRGIKYQQLQEKLGGVVDENLWQQALASLPPSGSQPLFLNMAKLVSVPDKASRHNASSNSPAIFKELRSSTVPKGVKNLSVILVADYENVLSSVAAIARSFPLYSRKTVNNETVENVAIEVLVSDGKSLSDEDVGFLKNLCVAIREAGRLIDMPANELTTDVLVEEAQKLGSALGVKSTIIRGEDLKLKGFGGIYHVGKAGPTPPAFVVLSHEPADATETYALVGKGVVYDTGGMQIKGKTMMPNMKRDMGGAAGMLEAFATLVQSNFKQNLHACLCIVENNISPAANKPDDIITMLSGKTVEINNTDAEGRLILSDGVFYAKNVLKANTIIDMATLTGAQSYLSGKLHGAVLTNSEDWEQKLVIAGRKSGDLLHPMVFCPDLHFPDLKSPVADMRNSNLGKMEGPPSAIAGLFIGSHIDFGEGLNWIHLDIAAPAEAVDRGTGFGPALLSSLLGAQTSVPLLH